MSIAGLYVLVAHVRLHLQATAASGGDVGALRDEFGTELSGDASVDCEPVCFFC